MVIIMKKEYDFSTGIRNPFTDQLKTSVTITLSNEVFDYFNQKAHSLNIPIDLLLSTCLSDCASRESDTNTLKGTGI